MYPLPTNGDADLKSFRLQIDADARLAAGVGGVARYLADSGGMSSHAGAALQSAIVQACTESFENLTEAHPHLHITFSVLPDRLEIELSHEGGDAPALGLDTVAGLAAHLGSGSAGGPAQGGVDRVQYETKGGAAITRFTKYLRADTPAR